MTALTRMRCPSFIHGHLLRLAFHNDDRHKRAARMQQERGHNNNGNEIKNILLTKQGTTHEFN